MIFVIIISILFSILSTAIMSYIAMATATGPWIEPVLVFFGIICFRFLFKKIVTINANEAIAFSTVSGSLGGIIATACGWTVPTLYFLDPTLFNSWLNNPVYFCALLSASVLVAGGFGFIMANVLEKSLMSKPEMTFPIGALAHKMIFAQNQVRQTAELVCGAALTTVLNIIQHVTKLIPDKLKLIPGWTYGILQIPAVSFPLELLPIFVSIGFVTGHVIALPLLYGLSSKIFLIDPLQRYFFAASTNELFTIAFVTGMVLQSALVSLLEIPKFMRTVFKHTKKLSFTQLSLDISKKLMFMVTITFTTVTLIAFLSHFHFSLASQLYLALFTMLCTYQVIIIAGETGLAPVPRFATFVLIPGMLIFGFNAVQIMIVSLFVEICAGVAVDVLFGRKLTQLANMNHHKTVLFQLLGLIISALSIGIIFYLLIKQFGLGTPELFAYRAKARALLVQTESLDYLVMLLGALFAYGLKTLRVNAFLVMGGLLMPAHISLALIFGGLLPYLVKDKEVYIPFWSGVFAAGSLLMIIRAVV
jgi:hypothetical protein